MFLLFKVWIISFEYSTVPEFIWLGTELHQQTLLQVYINWDFVSLREDLPAQAGSSLRNLFQEFHMQVINLNILSLPLLTVPSL